MYMPNGGADVLRRSRRLREPADRQQQLRHVRRQMRRQPDVQRRHVRLHGRPERVRERVRQRADRQYELRRLRHPLRQRHELSGGPLRLPGRRPDVQRRGLHRGPERPEQLRHLRQRVLCDLGQAGVQRRQLQRRLHDGLRSDAHQLQQRMRQSANRQQPLRHVQSRLRVWCHVHRRNVHLFHRRHDVQQRVHQHADRQQQLRLVRQSLPGRTAVQ
jgi:hypothetical protein